MPQYVCIHLFITLDLKKSQERITFLVLPVYFSGIKQATKHRIKGKPRISTKPDQTSLNLQIFTTILILLQLTIPSNLVVINYYFQYLLYSLFTKQTTCQRPGKRKYSLLLPL